MYALLYNKINKMQNIKYKKSTIGAFIAKNDLFQITITCTRINLGNKLTAVYLWIENKI